jgi:hypothetical protein
MLTFLNKITLNSISVLNRQLPSDLKICFSKRNQKSSLFVGLLLSKLKGVLMEKKERKEKKRRKQKKTETETETETEKKRRKQKRVIVVVVVVSFNNC